MLRSNRPHFGTSAAVIDSCCTKGLAGAHDHKRRRPGGHMEVQLCQERGKSKSHILSDSPAGRPPTPPVEWRLRWILLGSSVLGAGQPPFESLDDSAEHW